jgi:hypothetical protein
VIQASTALFLVNSFFVINAIRVELEMGSCASATYLVEEQRRLDKLW